MTHASALTTTTHAPPLDVAPLGDAVAAQSQDTRPRFVWTNADQETGPVRGISHLLDLVGRVGVVPGLEWLRIGRVDQARPFAQLCGHARYGLIVEFSTDDFVALVAPTGAPEYPQRQCGGLGWIYDAHPGELLPLSTSVTLAYTWVTAGAFPEDQFELRDPSDRTRGWAPATGSR